MRQGLFKVTYGQDPLVEFIHVDNVVQALLRVTTQVLQPNSKSVGLRDVLVASHGLFCVFAHVGVLL